MNYRSIFTATAFAVAFSASAAVAAPLVPVDGNDGSPDLFEAFNSADGLHRHGQR
jgi:hypothetical protein